MAIAGETETAVESSTSGVALHQLKGFVTMFYIRQTLSDRGSHQFFCEKRKGPCGVYGARRKPLRHDWRHKYSEIARQQGQREQKVYKLTSDVDDHQLDNTFSPLLGPTVDVKDGKWQGKDGFIAPSTGHVFDFK